MVRVRLQPFRACLEIFNSRYLQLLPRSSSTLCVCTSSLRSLFQVSHHRQSRPPRWRKVQIYLRSLPRSSVCLPVFALCLCISLTLCVAQQQNSGTPAQSGQQPSNPPPAPIYSPNPSQQQPQAGFSLPQPSQVGNLDLSKIQPSSSGSVDIHQALAQFAGRGQYIYLLTLASSPD